MKMIFEKLPQTLDEMMALPYSSLEKPEYAIGLFICAMCAYPQDREAAYQMVDFLNGPTELTPMAKQFLRDRMMENDHVPFSFFEGSSPENDYTPSQPYTIEITENPYSYQNEGYATLYVRSSGADSPRSARVRLKPSTSQWFLDEQMLLSGIRTPVSKDPWA